MKKKINVILGIGAGICTWFMVKYTVCCIFMMLGVTEFLETITPEGAVILTMFRFILAAIGGWMVFNDLEEDRKEESKMEESRLYAETYYVLRDIRKNAPLTKEQKRVVFDLEDYELKRFKKSLEESKDE